MRTMDYSVSFTAGRWGFEPVSEGAKAITPNGYSFEDRAAAFEKMLELQGESFRFSGAHLLDSEQKLVKNGYFLMQDNGQIVPIGNDLGPRVPVWKVGDAMPLRDENGVQTAEGEIIEILDDVDTVPRMFGCTVAFILKERKRN